MSTTSSTVRKSRNESPAPKASAKAGSKASTPSLSSPAPKPTAPPAKPEEKTICGFHPEVFRAVFLAPLVLAIFIGAAIFLDVGKTVVRFVDKQWSIYSAPAEKFLATNAETILILAAAAALAPFVVVFLVNVWGALMDLGNFALWQQLLLFLLVVVAMGTAINTEICLQAFALVRSQWDKISDPVEGIFKTKSDSILAGVALCCFAPIAAALVTYALRAIWNCRVKIIVEPAQPGK